MKVWMEKNCVPENLRKEIMVKIREKLEQDKHADVENLFSILPWATRKSLKRVLCMSTLRKVPMLEGMNPKVLKMICDYLKPVIYPENSYVAEADLVRSAPSSRWIRHCYVAKVDEPVDRMVLVTEGTMWIYSSNSTGASASNKIHRTVENGGIYGDEQLLSWVSKNMQHVSLATIPISTENVKCHTRVEGFAITATDLKAVATKCKMYWNYDDPREKQRVASSTIGMSFRRNRADRVDFARRTGLREAKSTSRGELDIARGKALREANWTSRGEKHFARRAGHREAKHTSLDEMTSHRSKQWRSEVTSHRSK
ncbi:hypothetical protein ACLB2K_075599 [Fragaria x ananassa]